MTDPVVEFQAAGKTFRKRSLLPRRRHTTHAVRELNLTVSAAEVVALVGESGAGKSTAGKLALGLDTPDSGDVRFEGASLTRLRPQQLRRLRRRTHLVLQDPYQALHPAMRVKTIVAEALSGKGLTGNEQRHRIAQALEEAQLIPAEDFLDSYPHQLSGGQRQRVAFARAVVNQPQLVVADEPVSMLDVSLQAGILTLIGQMRQRHDISFLFITHDLAVARHVADRIAVLHGGRLLELGPANRVINQPHHPYTEALVRAVEDVAAAAEETPSFPPGGQPCETYGRCQPTDPECRHTALTHVPVGDQHTYAVHIPSSATHNEPSHPEIP
jgi:peptide/nickel transport system ATP-binding protein